MMRRTKKAENSITEAKALGTGQFPPPFPGDPTWAATPRSHKIGQNWTRNGSVHAEAGHRTALESLVSPYQRAAVVPVSPASDAETRIRMLTQPWGFMRCPPPSNLSICPKASTGAPLVAALSHVWGEIWAGLAAFGWLGLAAGAPRGDASGANYSAGSSGRCRLRPLSRRPGRRRREVLGWWER